MSKKKKTVFAKPQLCQEFGVTERTLNYLTELELIAPDWTYRHGLPIVELTEDDRLTLSCAGNAIHNNLRGRLPFQRFLYLRFIQMPLEYIQFELAEKNLMDAARVTPTMLKTRYEEFLSRVPEGLRDCIDENRPPKTKEEKALFDKLLDVCEIRIAYEHPEWDEAFSFMNNKSVKIIVDAALTTTGSYQQISAFLYDALEVNFTPEGLLFYQQLFHDMEMMDDSSMKLYFKGISPLHRQELQLAHGTPLEVYKLQSGLHTDIQAEEVLEIAISQVCQKVIELTADVSMADSEETYKAIRTFNILMDRHTKVIEVAGSQQSSNVPDFFKTLTLTNNDITHGKMLDVDPNADFDESKVKENENV